MRQYLDLLLPQLERRRSVHLLNAVPEPSIGGIEKPDPSDPNTLVLSGAIGGKVTGAGGGGYMLFYCDYRTTHRVAEAMLGMDARVEEFAFEQEGLRTWRVP